MARVSINSNGKGRAEVHIDERKIHGVRAFTLTGSVQGIDVLTLDFPLPDGSEITGEALVVVQQSVHDGLVDLGWTPPTASTAPAHPAVDRVQRQLAGTTLSPGDAETLISSIRARTIRRARYDNSGFTVE